jgi:hypothetical protein
MGRRREQVHEYDPLASDLERDIRLAIAPTQPRQESAEPRTEPAQRATPPTKAKRYKVTQDEDLDLARFVLRLQEESRTKINLALLNRACNTLLIRAEAELLREVRATSPLRQPSNNDAVAYAEFEDAWRRIIDRALRRRGSRQ